MHKLSHTLHLRIGVFVGAAVAISATAFATQPPRPETRPAAGAPTARGAQRPVESSPPPAQKLDATAPFDQIMRYNTTRGLTGVVNRAKEARGASLERSARQVKGIEAGPPIVRETAVKGKWQIPVIMVTFADTPTNPYPVANLQKQLFNGPWPTRTMTEYYQEISGGRLEVRGTVYNWIKLPMPEAHYVGPAGCKAIKCSVPGFKDLLVQALTTANTQMDFAQYDNDGADGIPNSSDDDGQVDFVAIVHPTRGGECGAGAEHIWSHRYRLTNWGLQPFETKAVRPNGTKILIDDYVVMPALSCDGVKMIEIGVFAHEFGHAFGLPDLYDTTYKSAGIGAWGLMGFGSWGGDTRSPQTPSHMSAWEKEYLGWTKSELISEDKKNVVLRAGPGGTGPVRIDIDDDRAYLLEYRAKAGFDQSLTGAGLLVWQVRNGVVTNGLLNNGVNATVANKGLGLMEADGLAQLDSDASRGDAGDIYPGTTNKTTFDMTTTPRSEGKVALCNIRAAPTSVTLDILVSRSTCAASAGGTVISLGSNVLFDTAQYQTKPSAAGALRAVADRIKATTDAKVVVHGHTDSQGEPGRNQLLSERRAEAVKTWLTTDGGIAAQSISTIGHGATKLVDSGGKPVNSAAQEDRAKSRRVEIEITSAAPGPAAQAKK